MHSPLESKAVWDGSVQTGKTRQLSMVFCRKSDLSPGSNAIPASYMALPEGICFACEPGLLARDDEG